MRKMRVAAFFCVVIVAVAQPPSRVYPGARLDKAATDQAKASSVAQPELEVAVYTTPDAFDAVYGFYQKNGKEYKVLGARIRKLPNGKDLRDAFFILDGAPDLTNSKRWVKIQRPYLGQYGLGRNGAGQNEIRDVTAIVVTRKK